MKHTIHLRLATLLLLIVCVGSPGSSPRSETDPDHDRNLTLSTSRERGSLPGRDEHFTGVATISMLFVPNGPRDFSGASVSFEPGARTAWHIHPAGQTLIVTEGHGWVQVEGQKRRELKPGDVVWTPPGVRHWHGATASDAMTHLALQGEVDGVAVRWLEQVSEPQYLGTQPE